MQVTEEDCLAVLDRRACDLVYRKAGLVAAEGLPSHSAAGQILREGEIAEDLRWAASAEAGAQYLLSPTGAADLRSGGGAAACSFRAAVALPRAALMDAIATGDSTWTNLKNTTVTIQACDEGVEFVKDCVVRCSNGGSLMQVGMEPTPPALAEVRHELECEPDNRRIHCVCFPVVGGKYRTPEYGAAQELSPEMCREAGVL